MAGGDDDLASALKQAKRAPMRFAFVAKGTAEGKLLVAKKTIPAKETAQARKELGGGLLFRGRCLSENGKLVFEVPKQPPSTLAKQLKSIISRDAGLTLQVEVRVAPDLAEEEGEAPPEGAAQQKAPPPPPPPGADKAAVMKRLSALAGPYQAALAAKAPDAPRMQSLFGAIKGLLGSQDFAQAGKVLDELEPLVARAKAAGPPASAAERFRERLARVEADFDRLKAALPERAAPLQAMMNLAQKRGQEGKHEPGLAVLAELDARVQAALRTLGAPPPPPPPPPPAGDGAARFTARLKALLPQIQQVQAGNSPASQEVKLRASEANSFARKKDFAQANALLDQVEALLKQAAPAAALPPSPAGAGKAAVLQRLSALAGPYQQAVARKGPDVARVQSLFGAIKGLVGNQDFEQAGKVLDELEPLLAAPPPPSTGKADLLKRLNALSGPLKAALKGPNAARVQTLFGAINGLVKAGDFAKAARVLDELEPLLAAPPPAEEEEAAYQPEVNRDLQQAALLKRLAQIQADEARLRRRLEELAAVPKAERTQEQRDEKKALVLRLTLLYQELLRRRNAFEQAVAEEA